MGQARLDLTIFYISHIMMYNVVRHEHKTTVRPPSNHKCTGILHQILLHITSGIGNYCAPDQHALHGHCARPVIDASRPRVITCSRYFCLLAPRLIPSFHPGMCLPFEAGDILILPCCHSVWVRPRRIIRYVGNSNDADFRGELRGPLFFLHALDGHFFSPSYQNYYSAGPSSPLLGGR